jgi:catechol 2,3-dioxygenase-like lactoylglutathione lyase family enzyme
MNIERLHHAQITIPNGGETQARAFYSGLLGLREIEKPDSLKLRGGFWLALGDVQIHVGTEDGVDHRDVTNAHLAYQVDDLHTWRTKLAEAGFHVGDSVPIPGFDRFEFRDPFGNRIEFIQPMMDN